MSLFLLLFFLNIIGGFFGVFFSGQFCFFLHLGHKNAGKPVYFAVYFLEYYTKLAVHLVRKDMCVNEHERLLNITCRHKFKQRNSTFNDVLLFIITVRVFNNEHNDRETATQFVVERYSLHLGIFVFLMLLSIYILISQMRAINENTKHKSNLKNIVIFIFE